MPSQSTPLTEPLDTASFLTETRPALVRFFRRRCQNQWQAEDLAQEVIVRMLRGTEWSSLGKAKGYVFCAAANLWRDQKRRLVVRGGAELSWDENVVSRVSGDIPLDRVLVGQEALARVSAALLQLSERTRDVFVLSRLEQMKNSEIAAMFGISESAVEQHMTKAIAHLARRIRDRDPL
jgi:RNA polymerase sigma-70 factor (ECF subfamily)